MWVCSSVQSAYRERLSLGPELFAFLAKPNLEGAFNVFALLSGDPLIYLTSLWRTGGP